MYKFYQEQPENNLAYHPMRDENREKDEKKDTGNDFTNPEVNHFNFGNHESPMGQGQNKQQDFTVPINPANNRVRTIPTQPTTAAKPTPSTAKLPTAPHTQPQKNNMFQGGIASSNKKPKDWKERLKDAFEMIRAIPAMTTGAYTPDNFFPNKFMPFIFSGFRNYRSMRDIDKWEEENKKRSDVHRERVEGMKDNSFTSLIARAYEKTMDAKIARELAFPLKSPVHAAAAIDIGLGTNDNYNNLSSASNRFAKEIDDYFGGEDGKDKKKGYISTLRNSMRHTIWQATLASQYNPQVAYSAGMAHETRPYADTDKRVFDNESDADMVVDLLNNAIGRRIGAKNRHLSRQQIALLALKELRDSGLYQYEHFNDGLWRVMKVRISNDVYNEMYNTFINLDNDGL